MVLKVCAFCSKPFTCGRGRVTCCSHECRLLSHVLEDANGCWLWQAGTQGFGYGKFEYGEEQYAHRVAWLLLVGPIPAGMILRHTCDVPPCVNPDHLIPGTQKQNVRDCYARKRNAPTPRRRGEEHHAAKLTEHTVREIRRRASDGEYQTDLAEEFSVSTGHLSLIVSRQTWRHVV